MPKGLRSEWIDRVWGELRYDRDFANAVQDLAEHFETWKDHGTVAERLCQDGFNAMMAVAFRVGEVTEEVLASDA